jgi:photosystem II stability/assembly factor-like uncharacterized protein
MTTEQHKTNVYVGLAGESPLVLGMEGAALPSGGLYRQTEGDAEWQSIAKGLPGDPQVRALMVHPQNPAVIFAGTQAGVYRSEDRGEHWEATDSRQGDVWSIAAHPNDSNIMFAGYDYCNISRSEDGGATWRETNTDGITFPHITMSPHEIVKRVIGISADPGHPDDVYGAVEVGGLVASRNGGESWESITDGHYTRTGPVDLHGVQVNPAAPGLVYIITQLAMFRSRNRGTNWEFVSIDEMFPGGSYCRDLVVAPNDPQVMYLAAGAGGGSAPPGTTEAGVLIRSRDAGETWQQMDLGEVAPSRMFQIAIDPAAPNHVYCCDRDGLVFSSEDGGESWSKSRVPGEMSRGHHVYPMVCG